MKSKLKISASKQLVLLCQDFLKKQTTTLESSILHHLDVCLKKANFDRLPDGFIEWGCIEHNIVDVFAFEGQQVIRIDPINATITAL